MPEKSAPFELMDPPAAAPLLPDFGLWVWFAGGAALLVLAALAAWLFIRRKNKRAADPESVRQRAYREAASSLDSLAGSDARDTAVRCSLVLRGYLVKAAADPALFETHEEFVARHDSLHGLAEPARASAHDGFTRLARAKYSLEGPARPPAEIVADARVLLETLHQGWAA